MAAMSLMMDGIEYHVRIVYNSLVRAFELLEGVNAGEMLSGRYERDLIGTRYTYEMAIEPDPQHLEDYDALYDALSDPISSHSITVPYGQTTLTYNAMIESGTDTYKGKLAGMHRWGGLTVIFKAISVQRESYQ